MENLIINVLASAGVTGFIIIVFFYIKVKKIIEGDIVKPLVDPLKQDIETLKSELIKKDDKLEKISEILQKNTESLQKIETIFDLFKDKIEVSFKEK